jgi:DNA-binding XRE family transcriptional regulator
MKNGSKDLARRVEEFRLSQQWTQVRAAVFFKVSHATYMRIESGKGCSKLTRAKVETILAQQAQAA